MDTTRQSTHVFQLTKIALCVALLCVSSYIAIPLPFTSVVLTAQTLVINVVALILTPVNRLCGWALYSAWHLRPSGICRRHCRYWQDHRANGGIHRRIFGGRPCYQRNKRRARPGSGIALSPSQWGSPSSTFWGRPLCAGFRRWGSWKRLSRPSCRFSLAT